MKKWKHCIQSEKKIFIKSTKIENLPFLVYLCWVFFQEFHFSINASETGKRWYIVSRSSEILSAVRYKVLNLNKVFNLKGSEISTRSWDRVEGENMGSYSAEVRTWTRYPRLSTLTKVWTAPSPAAIDFW